MKKTIAEQIKNQLQVDFNPSYIELTDESHLHAGHAGAKTGKGHYKLIIKSDYFAGKPSVVCHKMIYQSLDILMAESIHALSITIQK